jgi:glycine/D-amino acid oxidase-like deaminating enzyme
MLPARQVLSDLQPGLAIATPEAQVAWFPDDAWIDPVAATNRLVEGVRNAGGRVLTGRERDVVAIGVQDTRVTSVTLRGGQTIPVAAVVNAAGVNADRVAALVGRHLVVTAPRSLALHAELPGDKAPLLWPLRSDRLFMRPDGLGRVMLVPQVDVEDTPQGPIPLDDPRVTESLALGSEVVPALIDARPVNAVVAAWPLMADGLPCVGAVPAIPGYFEAVTDYGITLAPLVARSLAEEILGRRGYSLLDPFRPKSGSGS